MAKQGKIVATTKTGQSGVSSTISSPDRTPCTSQESAMTNPTASPYRQNSFLPFVRVAVRV